jgi:hypothetical protein
MACLLSDSQKERSVRRLVLVGVVFFAVAMAMGLSRWAAATNDGPCATPISGDGLRFEGEGDQVFRSVLINKGLIVFHVEVSGEGFASAVLYAPNNERVWSKFFDGPYEGQVAYHAPFTGHYTLAVESDDAWLVEATT